MWHVDICLLELCFHLEKVYIRLPYTDLQKDSQKTYQEATTKQSLILNDTESACSGPIAAYVELFDCRLGSAGRSQALVTTSAPLRPKMKL